MSKLKDLVSRGVRLIVTDVPEAGAAAADEAAGATRDRDPAEPSSPPSRGASRAPRCRPT